MHIIFWTENIILDTKRSIILERTNLKCDKFYNCSHCPITYEKNIILANIQGELKDSNPWWYSLCSKCHSIFVQRNIDKQLTASKSAIQICKSHTIKVIYVKQEFISTCQEIVEFQFCSSPCTLVTFSHKEVFENENTRHNQAIVTPRWYKFTHLKTWTVNTDDEMKHKW